ncbi:MAG: hypothetical protein M1833_005933 [Piccolia ochrophora]|nr:MAG: hypothetical protein M1833_005933 [Piccolia ochrophora]
MLPQTVLTLLLSIVLTDLVQAKAGEEKAALLEVGAERANNAARQRLGARQNADPNDVIDAACETLPGNELTECQNLLVAEIDSSIQRYCVLQIDNYEACLAQGGPSACENEEFGVRTCAAYTIDVYNFCIQDGRSDPAEIADCANFNLELDDPSPATTSPTSTSTSTSTVIPTTSLVCNQDNVLRALGDPRYSASASTFCSTYLTGPTDAPLPTYVSEFPANRVSSACECFNSINTIVPTPDINTALTTSSTETLTSSTPTSTSSATTATRLVCFQDNVLRALQDERYSALATVFCPLFLDDPNFGPLPSYVSEFPPNRVSSGCSCLGSRTQTPTSAPTPPVTLTTTSSSTTTTSLVCNEDNVLRALIDERYAVDALEFCQAYLAAGGSTLPLPSYVSEYSAIRVSSACTCDLARTGIPVPSLPSTTTSTAISSTTTSSLVCFEDNVLRALKDPRYSLLADTFCLIFLTSPDYGPLPAYVAEFPASRVSSACSCYTQPTPGPSTTSSVISPPTTTTSPPPVVGCSQDNVLRALEDRRYSSSARAFCPSFLASPTGGALPFYVSEYSAVRVSSACSCFEGIGPSTSPFGPTPTTTGPPVTATSLICYQDNVLRALEDQRYSASARTFCATFLAQPGGALPTYIAEFGPIRVSSACSCLESLTVQPTNTPTPTTSSGPLVCYQDNVLRALEDPRYSASARLFCPTFLAQPGGALPTYVAEFGPTRVSSACSCFETLTGAATPATTPTSSITPISSFVPVCNDDNVLRALQDERYSASALLFCPTFLASPTGGALPFYVSEFSAVRVSSACTCDLYRNGLPIPTPVTQPSISTEVPPVTGTSSTDTTSTSTSTGTGTGTRTRATVTVTQTRTSIVGGTTTVVGGTTVVVSGVTTVAGGTTTVVGGSTTVTQEPSVCIRRKRVRAVRA